MHREIVRRQKNYFLREKGMSVSFMPFFLGCATVRGSFNLFCYLYLESDEAVFVVFFSFFPQRKDAASRSTGV